MWHARVSRRDFIEIWLGAHKALNGRLQKASGISASFDDDVSMLHAYWNREPNTGYALPSLVVVPNGEAADLFAAINSSPQAALPVSAFCRVLTRDEAKDYFSSAPMDFSEDILPFTVALAMVEAVIHSEGRIGFRQLSPAACKRTLSYAWGKALATKVPEKSLAQVPDRWLDSYKVINSQGDMESIRRTIKALLNVLTTCSQLSLGIKPDGASGAVAYSLLRRDKSALEKAWKDLSKNQENRISLEALAVSTREERGIYLQQALRQFSKNHADESSAAACAFIATQVAPGSLEHFDLLRATGNSEVLFWYSLFASLQSPSEIMAGQGGLGLRVLRDIANVEEHLSRPGSDVFFTELKALERIGVESISRRLGHTSEIEVEIIPLVTASFTYSSKVIRQSRNESYGSQLPLDSDSGTPVQSGVSTKVRIAQAIDVLSQLLKDIPDRDDFSTSSSAQRRGRRTDPKLK